MSSLLTFFCNIDITVSVCPKVRRAGVTLEESTLLFSQNSGGTRKLACQGTELVLILHCALRALPCYTDWDKLHLASYR